MSIDCKVIFLDVDELKPYGNNPRKNKNAINAVAKSIESFGFKQPIVIDKNNVIIAGHTRLEASKKIGLHKVPCIYADDLSDEQVKAYRIADNKTNELAEWDFEKLEEELKSIDFDFSDFDFDFDNADGADGVEAKDDNFDVDGAMKETPKTKRGDLYKLGNHFLLCGDSTDALDVIRLMSASGESVKAKLVLTDPPYGIDIVGGNSTVGGGGRVKFGTVGGGHIVKAKTYARIIGDESTETAEKSYNIYKDFSENQIIFGGNYFTGFLNPSSCWLVWDKEINGNFADVELAWTSFNKAAKLYRWLWNGMSRKGDHKTEGKTRVHPTQKPAGMLAEILKDFSVENDIILDVFGGSGSTLIACEQLNRQCRMIEMSEAYCDVIVKRWETYTGKKAEIIKTEKSETD